MGGDVAQGLERAEFLGFDGRDVGKPFLESGEDFDPFDGVNSEVGIEAHVEFEHFGRVPGFLRNDLKQNLQDIIITRLNRTA
jgi:hypothetical protein